MIFLSFSWTAKFYSQNAWLVDDELGVLGTNNLQNFGGFLTTVSF